MIAPAPVELTGDDTPATSLWRYVWRMSGWRQLGLCALALLATALNLAPIELQRRLVDDAIAASDMALLWSLGLLYAGAILAHQGAKFALLVCQGWLSESATNYTRTHLLGLWRDGRAGQGAGPGEAAAILGGEVDRLGGFVGTGPSGAFADATLLLGLGGYMLFVDPPAAAIALALVAPQALLAPFMQRRLNRLMADQVSLGRDFAGALEDGEPEKLAPRLYRNRMLIHVWKQIMKAALNLLNAAAPLGLLLVVGMQVIEGSTTLGVLVAFLTATTRLADPIRNLIGFYRRAAQAGVQHDMIASWM